MFCKNTRYSTSNLPVFDIGRENKLVLEYLLQILAACKTHSIPSDREKAAEHLFINVQQNGRAIGRLPPNRDITERVAILIQCHGNHNNVIRIEYELPLAGHDCDYKANTPLLLPFLKCTDQFLIKTKTFPRSEIELNREKEKLFNMLLLKRYENFDNENFLLRPWFDYVKDRQLGLIRG